ALFGAELTKPATITGHGTVFAAPVLGMNKRVSVVESGRRFLQKLSNWLARFGGETQKIAARTEQVNAQGEPAVRLRLILSPKAESLSRLWGRVGFEYNAKRSGLAALAAQYLKHKSRTIANRAAIAQQAADLVRAGTSRQAILLQLSGTGVNDRF